MADLGFKKAAKKNKSLRYGGYMTIFIILAIVAVVVINLLFQQLRLTVDLTQEKLYTTSARTKILLQDMTDDVTIYGVYRTGNEAQDVVALIEDYIKNGSHVSYKQIDPYKNPEQLNDFKEDTESIVAGTLVVVNERTGKYKRISESELYDYTQQTDQSTYQTTYVKSAFKAEEALSSAIQYVTNDHTPVLYTLTGHGESAVSSAIQTLLKRANFDMLSLNLLTDTVEANNYTVLWINNPMQDISAMEYDVLLEYMEAGGRMMICLSVATPETMPNFKRLMERYGIEYEKGTLIETEATHYFRNMPYMLMPDIGTHDVTADVQEKTVVAMVPSALKILDERPRSVSITPLLSTSSHAVVKKNPESTVADYVEADGDLQGTFYVGLLSEETRSPNGKLIYTRMAVFGSSYLFDYESGYVTAGNYNLLLGTLNYLQNSVDSIYISPKEYISEGTLTITAQQVIIWGVVYILVIPIGLIAIGLIIWSRRKRL